MRNYNLEPQDEFNYETLSYRQIWYLEHYGEVPNDNVQEDEDDWGFWNDEKNSNEIS